MSSDELFKRSKRTDRILGMLAFLILAVLQGLVRQLPSAESKAIEGIWTEIRSIKEAMADMKTDIKVVQVGQKDNDRLDSAISDLSKRMISVETNQARDEGRANTR